MRYIVDNKGVALITAVIMVMITLAIIVGVLLMLNEGQKVSGLTRQYETARHAAYGAAEFTASEVLERELGKVSANNTTNWQFTAGSYGGRVVYQKTEACFIAKLNNLPENWPAECNDTSATNIVANHDFRVSLSGTASQAPFDAYVKIVDSRPGNTSFENVLVDENAQFHPHIPYMYRVEILAQRANNPDERAMLSGLLAY